MISRVAAAAVSIAVRWPTAATSSWLRPPKMSPAKTSTAKSASASALASQVPQSTAITIADTTT
jgi:hypothetical protein